MNDNSDRLPWLEAADDEEPRGPSAAKLIGVVLIALIAIGIIAGGLLWLREQSEGGRGEIIAAPRGDYKIKPADPGGLDVAGQGETAFAASEGEVPKGRLDTSVVPETPAVAAPAVSPPAAQPAGEVVQLGAFSSEALARRAWTTLSERFRYLAPLSHTIIPVQADGRTLYRLRASGADAADVCRRLRIAGEECTRAP